MKSAEKKGFTYGFVYAVAQCIRLGQEDVAEQLWNESGFKESDIEGCDEYDVDEVKRLLENL